MHAAYIACLFGGGLATVLFAVLGQVGGHGVGHTHGTSGHIASGHAASGQSAQPLSAHGTASHIVQAHGHALANRGLEAAHAQAAHQHTSTLARDQMGHGALSSSLGWAISWLSPLTLAAAALWFGAAGLLVEGAGGIVALLVAVIAAVLGAMLVRALLRAFARASTPPLQLTAEGALATVNATIKPGATGEVVYTLEGLHRSVPARSEDSRVIPRGTTVVIVRREGGFAWVSPLDPLDELEVEEPTQPAGDPLDSTAHGSIRSDT